MMNRQILISAFLCCCTALLADSKVELNDRGVSHIYMQLDGKDRDIVSNRDTFGILDLVYTLNGKQLEASTRSVPMKVISQSDSQTVLQWETPEKLTASETLQLTDGQLSLKIRVENKTGAEVRLNDVGMKLPVLARDETRLAQDNYSHHVVVNKHASFLYFSRYDGHGNVLMMLPQDGTALEYATAPRQGSLYYIHSEKAQQGNITGRENGKSNWPLPPTGCTLARGGSKEWSLLFFRIDSLDALDEAVYQHGGVNFKAVPGMTIPRGETVQFALRNKAGIGQVTSQYPQTTVLGKARKGAGGYVIRSVRFDKLGVNTLHVKYGKGREMILEYFVTEPIETLIDKRARFITQRQQHRDTSKWYDGVYSLYDMNVHRLLGPDDMGRWHDRFFFGGADDPSNSKPVYVSEKNVIYPDASEIESLEYYEKNFVWGKLQRTDKEYPYPYGIYGSDYWVENRAGKDGDYGSGGSGKERMWRTFDYVTHIAIYYNLYQIARRNPSLVHYLDADGYLDRAYHTAVAYFEVPYNIRMGNQWNFHGWCDWAYKQGNFHERYILDLITALEENGRQDEADRLRYEWEKKVTYMVYEDPWPFGSEMFVDRTAYESSYYVAEYALTHQMPVHEQFWYDKNKEKWYSYREYPTQPMDRLMQNQLDGNRTLRGIDEPGFHKFGSAYSEWHCLDYMCAMGGVALLDYATRFSTDAAQHVRWGYNSLLSSWALMNTGDADSGYGYWSPGEQDDGAAGWYYAYLNDEVWTWRNYGPRGPMDLDGEVDHGFTGLVHGSGCYLVNDPLFGTIAYGGRLTADAKEWIVEPWDGVRRYLAIPQTDHFEMRLSEGGFPAKGNVRIAKDLSRLSFQVEKREECDTVHIHFTNLPTGSYQLNWSTQSGKRSQSFEVSTSTVTIPLPVPALTDVEIKKQQD